MASSSSSRSSIVSENELAVTRQELDEIKRDLEGWREALLPLKGMLMWDQPYHPAIIFGVTTFCFALIWIFEPSVLTTFAILGLVVVAADFAVPFIGPHFFANREWTGSEETEFEEICERILHCRTHLSLFVLAMAILKEEQPKIYFVLVMGFFIFWAWIGYVVNNLLLTYILVLTAFMIPGLRRRGILQKYFLKYWLFLKRMVFGRTHITDKKKQ